MPEYARFDGLIGEVQVRTILQHAWAEIEHDIQYKAVATLPLEIRRRFMTLAGLLEIADREFQALEDEDVRLRDEARQSVAAGRLTDVEITPDALQSYLDRKLGPDGRMSEFSYRWDALLLRRLGFTDLQQLDRILSSYDDDEISRTLYGTRQGQLTRMEDVLLAALGEAFVRRHPWANAPDNEWYGRILRARLERLERAGITIGAFDPDENPAVWANGQNES